MSAPRLRNERGFTLVEVLVASIVLTTALVALAELLAVSVRMHQLGRNSALEARLAQDKVEEMMKMNFQTNPAIQINANDTLAANVANYFDTPGNLGYTRRWRVAAGPNNNASLRTVTIRLVPAVTVGTPFEVTTILRSW